MTMKKYGTSSPEKVDERLAEEPQSEPKFIPKPGPRNPTPPIKTPY